MTLTQATKRAWCQAPPRPRSPPHEDPVPIVVRLVRAGIVLEGVDRPDADRPDRAPIEIAEVDDQVGRHAVDDAVDLLGAVCLGADVPALRIRDRGDLFGDLASHMAAEEVPGVLLANRPVTRVDASLRDIAPTVLAEFSIPVPDEMKGRPFLGH